MFAIKFCINIKVLILSRLKTKQGVYMIAFIKGTIISISENALIIDQTFIGLECIVPHVSLYTQGSNVELYTYVHWHQENGPSFYGFPTVVEKQIFLLLLGCSGIGPKMALSILEQMPPANLIETIMQEDTKALSSLHGIGAKKAEQLILQLKYKAQDLIKKYPELVESGGAKSWLELQQTLQSLNYSQTEIKQALAHLKQQNIPSSLGFDSILRKALLYLSQ